MYLAHENKVSSEGALMSFCNGVIISKGYFIDGYEQEVKNFVKHYAEGIHSKTNNVPLEYAEKALSKLLFEINKVYISNHFDDEFASSSCI